MQIDLSKSFNWNTAVNLQHSDNWSKRSHKRLLCANSWNITWQSVLRKSGSLLCNCK